MIGNYLEDPNIELANKITKNSFAILCKNPLEKLLIGLIGIRLHTIFFFAQMLDQKLVF
jgi:hypothetical protein